MRNIKRSPLFYVGDKYKLMDEILNYFPKKINRFIEPFSGGGTVFLNVNANTYLLNDIDPNVVKIHKCLKDNSLKSDDFFQKVNELIERFNLSQSHIKDVVPKKLKQTWKKTYYAKYNKTGYDLLKKEFNNSEVRDPIVLYLLLIYGFNRMLRFNSKGEFNIPVGNVDFNKNVASALINYFDFVKNKQITWEMKDFNDFLNNINYEKDDFVYLDPPYLISFSEYNKLWSIEKEKKLLECLDKLNEKEVKFAISNIIIHKNRKNDLFINWMKKYNVFKIKSNYISYHDNKNKRSEEVLVTNYETTKSRI